MSEPYHVRPHTVGSDYICGTCEQRHVAGCSQGTVRTTGMIHKRD